MVNTVESRGRLGELLREADCYGRLGVYGIEVKKVLAVARRCLNRPGVAIIEDLEDRVWAIPEGKGLVSRHNVREGTKLRLEVNEGKISEVLIISD